VNKHWYKIDEKWNHCYSDSSEERYVNGILQEDNQKRALDWYRIEGVWHHCITHTIKKYVDGLLQEYTNEKMPLITWVEEHLVFLVSKEMVCPKCNEKEIAVPLGREYLKFCRHCDFAFTCPECGKEDKWVFPQMTDTLVYGCNSCDYLD